MKKNLIVFVAVYLSFSMMGCAQSSDDDKVVYTATYQFTEQVRKLEAGTDGTAGNLKTYVEFGDWPQSEAVAGIEFNKEPESNGYYVGSDGNYYAKVLKPYIRVDGSITLLNTPKYFKVEPIKWCVLDTIIIGSNTYNLLFAEHILETGVAFCEDKDNDRTIGENTIHPDDYKYSQMRAYLNGLSYELIDGLKTIWNGKGFLQTAFTASAGAQILSFEMDNASYESINDKIYLLSKDELEQYASTNDLRKRTGTDYYNARTPAECYWLRTPLQDSGNAYYVLDSGCISINDVNRDYYGITPALILSFD